MASAGYNYYLWVHLSVDSRRYDQFISRRAGQGLPSGHLDPPGSVLPGQCHHTHCQYLHITYWQFSANFRHLFLLSPPRHLSQVRCCRAAVRSSPRHTAEKAKSKSKSKSFDVSSANSFANDPIFPFIKLFIWSCIVLPSGIEFAENSLLLIPVNLLLSYLLEY